MRRLHLGMGVALVALGAVSLVEAGRPRDGWLEARPATKLGIRK